MQVGNLWLMPVLLLGSSYVVANSWVAQANESVQDRRIQDEQVQHQLDVGKQSSAVGVQDKYQVVVQERKEEAISLKAEELQQYPDLIVRAMLAAILQNHGNNVVFLWPYYEKLPESMREKVVENWAKAIVARENQQWTQSIRLYRDVLAQANWVHVRLQLAMALFANKEWEAAADQFQKVRSEKDLPQEMTIYIDQYLQAIQAQNRWKISGGLTYLNDKNINNAPKQLDLGGGWRADEPESGEGVSFNVGVGKKWNWGKGVFSEARFDTNGKYYWDNRRYNELTARVSLGMGFQNAKQTLALLPFKEQTWYAGGKKDNKALKSFSHNAGAAFEWSYWFHSQWQGSIYAEAARQKYRTRIHLNGKNHFTSATMLYLPQAKQYWFAGIDRSYHKARDGDDSFIRKGARVGWGQEWGKGLSTRLSASYAHRDYRAAGFFRKVQHNKETGIQVSMWHRSVHFWGITPRLTWAYHKVDSNLPLYTYDKHRIFIELSKQF